MPLDTGNSSRCRKKKRRNIPGYRARASQRSARYKLSICVRANRINMQKKHDIAKFLLYSFYSLHILVSTNRIHVYNVQVLLSNLCSSHIFKKQKVQKANRFIYLAHRSDTSIVQQ